MASATLMIDGTLDLDQFWNKGESDADTTKLVIDITGISEPIHYQQFPGARSCRSVSTTGLS